ncbi:MAG: hypothetical protein ACJAVI_005168 [Candidatus Azotimanducaceae bacterium]|jgi:hypothetical protein
MIRYIALGLFLSCAMIAAQMYFTDEITDTPNVDSDKPVANQPSAASDTDYPATIPKGSKIGNTKQNPDTKPAASGTSLSLAANELWLSDTTHRPIPERYQRNGLIPEPLKFNHQQIKKLNVGDQVSLSIPQTGQAFDMQVQRVTKHQNGTRTLIAEITNTPVPYSVVVTEGSTTTFATVNTPEGTFSLDAAGDEAWLVAQLELDQLIDPNLLDYQIPDIHR